MTANQRVSIPSSAISRHPLSHRIPNARVLLFSSQSPSTYVNPACSARRVFSFIQLFNPKISRKHPITIPCISPQWAIPISPSSHFRENPPASLQNPPPDAPVNLKISRFRRKNIPCISPPAWIPEPKLSCCEELGSEAENEAGGIPAGFRFGDRALSFALPRHHSRNHTIPFLIAEHWLSHCLVHFPAAPPFLCHHGDIFQFHCKNRITRQLLGRAGFEGGSEAAWGESGQDHASRNWVQFQQERCRTKASEKLPGAAYPQVPPPPSSISCKNRQSISKSASFFPPKLPLRPENIPFIFPAARLDSCAGIEFYPAFGFRGRKWARQC